MTDKNIHPPAKYVSLLNKIIEQIQKNLKSQEQLLPVAFLLNQESKKTEIIGLPFKNEEDKDYHAEMLRQKASRMQADAICFLSEAWTLPKKYTSKDMVKSILQKYGEIANFPEKVEIVIINFETHEGIWTGIADIKPAKKGRKMVGLHWTKAENIAGRFTHLLPVKYGTPEQIKIFIDKAREKLIAVGINPDEVLEKKSFVNIIEEIARQSPAENLNDEMLDYMISSILEASRRFKDGKS